MPASLYRNRASITPFDSLDALAGAKHLIAGRCEDVGFIAGGDLINVVTNKGLISEEEVEPLSRMWWAYWRDYWRLRGTKNALQKD